MKMGESSQTFYPYPGAENAPAYELLNRCSDPEQKDQS